MEAMTNNKNTLRVNVYYPADDGRGYKLIVKTLARLGFHVAEQNSRHFMVVYNGRVWRDPRAAIEELARESMTLENTGENS